MPTLTLDTINAHVREAQYAVRGPIPQRAEEYRAKLAAGDGKDLPFDKIIFANIGNPQQLDQKPITFFRQVASLLEFPQLLESEEVLTGSLGYQTDAIARAKKLLKEVTSVGAYSNSSGAPGIKKSVADFIERMCFPPFVLEIQALTHKRS
jgi:alanine transaminase